MRSGEGARAIGAGDVVRQRVARQELGDARIDGDDQGVAGVCGGVEA